MSESSSSQWPITHSAAEDLQHKFRERLEHRLREELELGEEIVTGACTCYHDQLEQRVVRYAKLARDGSIVFGYETVGDDPNDPDFNENEWVNSIRPVPASEGAKHTFDSLATDLMGLHDLWAAHPMPNTLVN